MSDLPFDFSAVQNELGNNVASCNAVQTEVGGELLECSIFDIGSLAWQSLLLSLGVSLVSIVNSFILLLIYFSSFPGLREQLRSRLEQHKQDQEQINCQLPLRPQSSQLEHVLKG